MENESKKYVIETFKQLLNAVNSENRERFVLDFALFIYNYTGVIDSLKEKNPKLSNKKNTDIANCAMQWVDDGINTTDKIQFHIKETGEVIDIKKDNSDGQRK